MAKVPPTQPHYMREIAKVLSDVLPGLGFALFVFRFNDPGIIDYISNAQREDMIKALEETLTRFKDNQIFQVPEGN